MPELPLQYLDDAVYWLTRTIRGAPRIEQQVEQEKKDVAKSLIPPTKKALKILQKNAAEGILGFADDAAVFGSKLLKKQNPLKNKNSQQKPPDIQQPMKMAEYAPGIPSKTIKDLPRISEPQAMRLAIQKHLAKRAGLHYDVRIVDDKNGKAYSWAVRSLPTNPGDKVLAKLQPTHTAAYSTWSGVIPEGYGAGTVDLFAQDKIEVIKAEPQKITFNVYKTNSDTERYAMINTGGDDWLFYNVTPTRTTRPEVPAEKPHYKSINPETLDPTKPNEVWAPKIDGALNVFLLKPDKPIETYSYRPSAKGANKLIDHTFRMGLHRTTVPTAFKGSTVVLGETFARDRATGKVLSSTDTSARLLSNVWRSRELQERAPLDNIIFNVLRYNGRDVSKKPYAEKLHMLKQISAAIPQLRMPPLAYTEDAKKDLMKEVKSGEHPLTEEGVVVYKLDQDTPIKAKLQQDYDVFVRGVFPGEGKLKGKAAGGFTYSFKPTGPIVGRVGTGLSENMRKELWEKPKEYTGSLARIFAQQQLPSGALRMPVFKDIRAEKFANLRKRAYAPSAGPWYGAGMASSEPPSGYVVTLLEEGRTTREDGVRDPIVQQFRDGESDGTRPAAIAAHETDLMKKRRAEFLKKKADYTIGIPTAAAPSNVPAPGGIGGTGGGSEIYLSETRHLQGEHENPRLYAAMDFSNADNPASVATSAMTPIINRLPAIHEKAKIRRGKRA